MPGATPAPTSRSRARESPLVAKQPRRREARLSGSRWSSTHSTPVVMVRTSSTQVPSYPVPESSGTRLITSSVSASAPSRTARPTRWASTDLVIDAPRKSVSGPSPSAYHSWTMVPPSITSSEVVEVSSTHSASPRDRPAPTTSTARSRASDGSARPLPAGTVKWRHPGWCCGSVNVSPASRDPAVDVGTDFSRCSGSWRGAGGCTPPAGSPSPSRPSRPRRRGRPAGSPRAPRSTGPGRGCGSRTAC